MKSWFGNFGKRAPPKDDAKEQAARITREADIRRLYEAGTQREVLEELYKPEEVKKCIERFEQENELLKLVEETQLAEEAKKLQVAQQEATTPGDHQPASEGEDNNNNNNLGISSSSASSLLGEDKEGLKQISEQSGDDGNTLSSRRNTKFTLRFDSLGDDGDDEYVRTTVETTPVDGNYDHEVKDVTMDISMDDVNLVDIGFESVHVHGDDDDHHHHEKDDDPEQNEAAQGIANPHGSEDDLLKELLDMEGEESSNFDDSVTTAENLSHDDDHPVSETDEGEPTDGVTRTESDKEAPLVSIDTSDVMREQSAITIGSIGSHDSSEGAQHHRTSGDESTYNIDHHLSDGAAQATVEEDAVEEGEALTCTASPSELGGLGNEVPNQDTEEKDEDDLDDEELVHSVAIDTQADGTTEKPKEECEEEPEIIDNSNPTQTTEPPSDAADEDENENQAATNINDEMGVHHEQPSNLLEYAKDDEEENVDTHEEEGVTDSKVADESDAEVSAHDEPDSEAAIKAEVVMDASGPVAPEAERLEAERLIEGMVDSKAADESDVEVSAHDEPDSESTIKVEVAMDTSGPVAPEAESLVEGVVDSKAADESDAEVSAHNEPDSEAGIKVEVVMDTGGPVAPEAESLVDAADESDAEVSAHDKPDSEAAIKVEVSMDTGGPVSPKAESLVEGVGDSTVADESDAEVSTHDKPDSETAIKVEVVMDTGGPVAPEAESLVKGVVDSKAADQSDAEVSAHDEPDSEAAIKAEVVMDTGGPVALEAESLIATTELDIEIEVEDKMEACSVVEDGDDMIVDPEHMETTSVEDDEELSEPEGADEEMKDDFRAQTQDAMDAAL